MSDAESNQTEQREQRPMPLGTTAIIALLMAGLLLAVILRERSPVAVNGPTNDDSKPRLTLPEFRVNINTASAAELSLLQGVGQTLAERIVQDRSERGRFESLDDLARVRGVGRSIVERIRGTAVAE